jgi:CheY-like chemotaxis protein
MPLQALLVSRDGEAVSVLQTVMRQLNVESEVCAELQPAVEKLAEGATSAVVVDYDVEHATELLKLMRQNYPGTCVALAMVKGLSSIQAAYDMGANFVLIKPVSPDAASRSLGEATALVQRMLRRPSRMVVPTLAYVSFEGGQDPAIILDISEGGMAIQALQALEAQGPMRLRFELPGWLRNLDVAAEIVWTDSSGRAGLRFIDLSEDDQRCLQDWVRIHASDLHAPTRLADHPSAEAPLPLRPREREVPTTTVAPTVAQRLFSTLIDAAIVLLSTGLFFGAFLIFARHLPVSRWAWPIAMLTPLVFWLLYLYLFLAHPRGTPGMQVAERVKAAATRPPELFDLPPSPFVSASSRVLTWLEAQRAGVPRTAAAGDEAIPTPALTPGPSETPRPGNGLHS